MTNLANIVNLVNLLSLMILVMQLNLVSLVMQLNLVISVILVNIPQTPLSSVHHHDDFRCNSLRRSTPAGPAKFSNSDFWLENEA